VTDWLARKVRGVVDFRLPGDPLDIPPAVERARILEYYAQVRAASPGWGVIRPPVGNTNIRQKAPETAGQSPKTARRGPKTAGEHAPEQGDWWREP